MHLRSYYEFQMQAIFSFFFIFLQFGFLSTSSASVTGRNLLQNGTRAVPCPLDFDVLRQLVRRSRQIDPGTAVQCQYARQGLRLVQSEYLSRTGIFLPPHAAAESCWNSFEGLVDEFVPNFNIRRSCGFQTDWIAQGCMNITTRAEFESNVTRSALLNVVASCNQSLQNRSPCAICTTSLSNLRASYLTGAAIGNVSDCTAYPSIYAAAFANRFGPTDRGTANCLFSLDFAPRDSGKKNIKSTIIIVVIVVVAFLLLAISAGIWFIKRKQNKSMKRRRIVRNESNDTGSGLRLDSITGSTTVIRFTLDEIKSATKNFSRSNIIGRGGYGNVYKGVLLDGSEVALKRFKNCSAAGDGTFAHEVEVIASVRHVNLVGLRGYCTADTPFEGHQRIIVCDLVKNGSLYDHLFGSSEKKLSWPIRQKIALGTARGLAYLHYGAQPSIIHRDIKASNILLDEHFEPKLADFGLAKFAPEGVTHLSTRVAGTMGYVAPEYALYGQLTERSDVYSFGVLFLELLSGKKALLELENSEKQVLVADWAWDLIRKGKGLEVIDNEMPDMGQPELMEKFVMLAVLCSHPQLYARPTMDQVVKILETNEPVPSIPARPISLISDLDEIERSVSSMSGSGNLSTSGGYQPYKLEDRQQPSHPKEEDET